MCCVGFYALKLGLDKPSIEGVQVLSDAPNGDTICNWSDTEDIADLYGLNDDETMGLAEPEREADIAAIFAKHGVKVKFIN